MLSDVLSDAVREIEDYEEAMPDCYADRAEEIRKVKLEMMMLQLRFDMLPNIAEQCVPADFDWVRAEALKRGAERPPYQFEAVFDECMKDLWQNKFGVGGATQGK